MLIVAVTGVLAACHPRDHSEQTRQNRGTETQHVGQQQRVGQQQFGERRLGGGRRHGGNGLRRICADDIAKYCQNDDRKKRCLKQNMDKLSADCKTAVEAAVARKRNGDNGGKNNNNSDNGDN
ncbi:MAG TPA: hypothetical protein VII49_07220 [Rhizomicrobium sp.]